MYSILVADDEAIIREGIKYLFDYEALGFSICAEAENGEQALEKILAHRPDVVLLDIRMPGISGLETIRRAREQGYQGRVVVISSYPDFKYAQEAIRYGVQHYITKPIDEDELKRIFCEFRDALDKEALSRSTSALYRQKGRSSIIADLLLGNGMPERAQLADLGLSADAYQVVIFERADHPLLDSLQQNSKDPSVYDRIVLRGSEVLLLKSTPAIRRFHELLEFHRRTAHHGTADRSFFACGQSVTALADIPLSYSQACQLTERRFFCDPEQYVLDHTALPALNEKAPVVGDALLKKYAAILLDCIHSFNRRMIAQTLKELQDLLYNSSDSIKSIRLFLTDLYLQIKIQVSQLYAGSDIPFLTNAEIIRTIEQASYLYEIIAFFSQRLEVFMNATGSSNRDSVLDDILHYIRHNYASNITLENIAPLFGYNRSYLGKIFTKKMGQNFNSYVDHVRIEQAKKLLLSDNAKVYAIAERVGYKNVDYFHIKFRKYVGMSPAEFRKLHKEK